MIRVGIVGTGARAAGHVAALRRLEGVKITAFADPLIERARTAAEETGARAFADAAELWDLVDAVWICTPHHLHVEPTVAAARAGKHVFIEKPMAHSLEGADAMVDAGRAAGVKLMVGHNLRFFPQMRALRALVERGELGDLTAVWSRRLSGEDPDNLISWRQDYRLGGGFTMGNGSHELDLVSWIASAAGARPEKVSGAIRCAWPAYPYLDTYVRATVRFSGGVVGGFDGGYGLPLGGPAVRAAAGPRGMAVIEGEAVRLRRVGDREDQAVDLTPFGGGPGVRSGPVGTLGVDQEFLAAITKDRPPSVAGEAGRATLALCLAVHESARRGAEVELDQ